MSGRARTVMVVLSALVVAVGGGGLRLLFEPPPARAGTAAESGDRSVSDLTSFVQSSAALNLRLMALETLRRQDGVTDALAGLAKGKDPALAAFAATALGRQGTSEARSALRDLVTESTASTEARKAAMSALAVHFGSQSDLDWLTEQTAGDAVLKAHGAWLSRRACGK